MVIRMKGVKRVVSKGRVYFYHRKTMTKLPGEPGTTSFMDTLAAAENCAAAVTETSALPGTLGALIGAYRASPEFTELAERTRRDYQKVFDYLKPLDPLPLHEIDGAYLYQVRDKAFAKRRRRFANYVKQVLSRLFNWGKRRGLAPANPAADVDAIRRPRDAKSVNRSWKDAEIAAVLAAASPELKVAIALGAYLGLREADMLVVTWKAYDGTAFEIRQRKTGETLWIPAHAELRAILNAAKVRRTSPIIVVGARGQPYTQTGFQTRFFGLIRKLRLEGKIGDGLSFHGLRHTVGRKLAETGCDARTIAAILGHATTAMADHYSRHADRRQLARAAVAKMERAANRKRKTAADKNGKPRV
ncbi:MAG TPA: tyrosine-type recombinase/integrase [Stellaceae bacterium]|nr:tyrosine-type recombinase/integrase [Stellaceae bacterium]